MTVIAGGGTPECSWLPALQSLPLLELEAPFEVVVVAPHPDDEVLAVGGLMALLHQLGSRITVVAVTDGEASNPGGSVPAASVARRRAIETTHALARLRVPATVRRLRLPDGGAQGLESPLYEALQVRSGCWLVGPWAGDGHPDHEAVGRACAAIASRDGARLLSYPVWAWHWSAPGDPRLPWDTARRLELPSEVQVRKRHAINAFVSQVLPLGPLAADAPVLPPHVLARFHRSAEVLFG